MIRSLIILAVPVFIAPVFPSDSLPGAAPDMVLVAGGSFSMGGTDGQKDELPVHNVRVDPFFMKSAEVTVWEYLQCVNAGACRMPFWWNKRFFEGKADDRPGKVWLSMPVTGISWDDAQDYCRWLGPDYHLPTEAQWEYAARAGSSTRYFWGNTMGRADSFAVIRGGLAPVKSKKPNALGLYDMVGNAWEWCEDRYDKKYYLQSPVDNPAGPPDGKKYPYRVVRGGGWNEYPWNLRCANRNYGEPFRRYDGVGFRVCRSVSSQ